MSDTTTITPEGRANLRRLAGAATPRPWKMRKHCDESAHMEVADSFGIVCTTPFYGFEYPEQWTNGEYIAAACNAATRILDALEAAEARAEKAEAMVDWLSKVCAVHCRDKCTDDSQCNVSGCASVHCRHASADHWQEAARRAVAAGEGE